MFDFSTNSINGFNSGLNKVMHAFSDSLRAAGSAKDTSDKRDTSEISESRHSLRAALAATKEKLENTESARKSVSEVSEVIEYANRMLKRMTPEFADAFQSVGTPGSFADHMNVRAQLVARGIDYAAQGHGSNININKAALDGMTSNDGSREFEISDSVSVVVETRDLTAKGLGIDKLDFKNDKENSLKAINEAAACLDKYAKHIHDKQAQLEDIEQTLRTQQMSIYSAGVNVATFDAASVAAATVAGAGRANASSMMVAHGNIMADSVLNLLSD